MGWGEWGDWSDVPDHEEPYTMWISSTPYNDFFDASISLAIAVFKFSDESNLFWNGYRYMLRLRLSSTGATRLGGLPWGFCRFHRVEIEKTDNENVQHFWTCDDANYVAGWPFEGEFVDFTPFSYAVTNLALEALSPVIEFALSVQELVDAYRAGYTNKETDSNILMREWEHIPDYASDFGCFFDWIVEIDANQTVEFRITAYLITPYYPEDIIVPVGCTAIISTPPPPSEMSSSEKVEYGLEKSTFNEFSEDVNKLLMGSDYVRKIAESGESLYSIRKLKIQFSKIDFAQGEVKPKLPIAVSENITNISNMR